MFNDLKVELCTEHVFCRTVDCSGTTCVFAFPEVLNYFFLACCVDHWLSPFFYILVCCCMQLGCEIDITVGMSCLTSWYLSVPLAAENWLEPLTVSPLLSIILSLGLVWLWVQLHFVVKPWLAVLEVFGAHCSFILQSCRKAKAVINNTCTIICE